MGQVRQYLLSIIVPVYNVELYIAGCLQSLCTQGFENQEYEILCINDGSTDRSREIILNLAMMYPQIKLIEQKNQGVSAARNAGIEKASGDYLFFCDGDDYIEPYYLKKIITVMQENHLSSASFNLKAVASDTKFNKEEKNNGINWKIGGVTYIVGMYIDLFSVKILL